MGEIGRKCNRAFCNTVMCSRESEVYGYLCGDCFEQLCTVYFMMEVDDFMLTDVRSWGKEALQACNDAFPKTI